MTLTTDHDDAHDNEENNQEEVITLEQATAPKMLILRKTRFCEYLASFCARGVVGHALTNTLLLLLTFGFCWGVTGNMALPGGKIFTLILIFTSSYLSGIIASKIYLPDLCGMIVSGIILRNIPELRLEETLDPEWSSFLRGTALATILVRAGMGLDLEVLKKLSGSVLRLAFVPCVVEMSSSAVMSHLLLDLPWGWAFLLGSVLAAVSPAVVVPSLLSLSERGFGVDKGIPTLVIAASSLDDILAISVFGIIIGIIFAEGSIAFIALKCPLEIVMGTVYGLALGSLMWFIPNKEHKRKMLFRSLLLLLAALIGLFASQRSGFGGAGPLAALLLGLVAQMRWRTEDEIKNEKASVSTFFEMVWTLFKPFLFGLIGAEVAFSKIEPRVIGVGLATLAIGLLFRMATTFLVVCGNSLNIREKIFITISWMPKATVQAAIGGIALDMARKGERSGEEVNYALQIVSVAVLSIVITAPTGAIMISDLGPKLLRKRVQSPSQLSPTQGTYQTDSTYHAP